MSVGLRFIHDVAVAMTASIMEVFRPVLRDDEVRDAFAEIYERVKIGVQALLHENAQGLWRTQPYSRN